MIVVVMSVKKDSIKYHYGTEEKVNCISEDDYLWYKQNVKPSTSRFDYNTRERIVKIYNSIFNTNQKNTKCTPCMKGLLENINSYLVVWEK
jgi:hypothetical protein